MRTGLSEGANKRVHAHSWPNYSQEHSFQEKRVITIKHALSLRLAA